MIFTCPSNSIISVNRYNINNIFLLYSNFGRHSIRLNGSAISPYSNPKCLNTGFIILLSSSRQADLIRDSGGYSDAHASESRISRLPAYPAQESVTGKSGQQSLQEGLRSVTLNYGKIIIEVRTVSWIREILNLWRSYPERSF